MHVANTLLGRCLYGLVLVIGMLWSFQISAHPDLQVQIDIVTERIALAPDNTELLLQRGNLYRRHEEWALARGDFQRVRQIDPENDDVDWFEGRMEVEAGQVQTGMALLDRFLERHPGHPIALQNRAGGYLLSAQPLLAAEDYQAVIRVSAKPGPSLYGAAGHAYVDAGRKYFSQAQALLGRGLDRFPGEVMLTGLATDIALAQGDTGTAQALINSLPEPVLGLSRWRTRSALLDCQSGREAQALDWFVLALQEPGQATEWLQSLVKKPDAENCTDAALAILLDQ